jgi:uncharacterized protein DUF1572
MQDAFAAQYLNDAVQQFRQLKELAEQALAQIRDDEFFIALDEEANSFALLMKHLAGSMRARWTDFPSESDEASNRNRDSEFVIDQGDTKSALIEHWEAAWRCLFDAIEPLTAEDLAKTIRIRGRSLSVLAAINRQLVHYAYHVGQMVFLAKHLRSSTWQSLSIPRGKSVEFITAARQRREG